MFQRVTIVREDSDLSYRGWVFRFDERDCSLRLAEYCEYERPTTRHKWRDGASYDYIRGRQSTLKIGEFDVPQDVMTQAKQEFCNRVTVRL